MPQHQQKNDKKLKLLLQQSHSSLLAAYIAIVLATVVFLPITNHMTFSLWLMVMFIVNSWRHWRTKSLLEKPLDSAAVKRFLFISTIAGGTSWGAFGFFFDLDWPHLSILVAVVTLTIVPAGAVSSLGIYPKTFRNFWLSMIVSLTLSMIAVNNFELIYFSLMMLAYFLLLQRYSTTYANTIDQNLSLESANNKLLRETQASHKLLENAHANNVQQTQLASRVFEKILDITDPVPENIFVQSSPLETLSGDYQLGKHTPNGRFYLLFTDFTGHGISAALGAVPTALVFSSMSAKNQPIENIMHEINRRLHELLPTEFFCCASLVSISPEKDQLQIISAGLPPAIIIRQDGTSEQLVSETIPLGILKDQDYANSIQSININPDELLALYSDGISEAENAQGQALGDARLIALLRQYRTEKDPALSICNDIKQHMAGASQLDDMSLAIIRG